MDKTEVIEKFVEKTRKSKADVEAAYEEAIQKAVELGLQDTKAQMSYAVNRLRAAFSKTGFGSTEEMQIVLIGINKTDFGAAYQFEQAKQAWAQNKDKAVAMGLVNEDGVPLHTKGYNKGKPINVEDSLTKMCLGIAKKIGDDEDNKYETCILNLRGKIAEREVPLFTVFRASVGYNRKQDTDKLSLFANEDFSVETVKELTREKVEALFKEFYPNDIKTFDEIDTYTDEIADDFDRNVIIKGGVGSYLVTEDETKSNVLTLTEPVDIDNLDKMDVEKNVTCWVDKGLPVSVTEFAQDVWVIGRPRKNSQGQLSIATYGIYVPEEFRAPEDIQKIKPEDAKQESSSDSSDDGKGWVED